MRLTIINQFYLPDIAPTGHMAASLANHRAAQGDEVTVITSRGGYVPQSEDEKRSSRENPRVIRLWTPRLGKARILNRIADYASFYLLAIVRMLFLRRQDVVVSMTTPPYIAFAGLIHKGLRRRVRLVLWNMDCYPDIAEESDVVRKGGILSRLLRCLNRFLMKRVDLLVSLDHAMQERITSQYGRKGPPCRTAVIPNWERIDLFPRDHRPAPWSEAALQGVAGRFVILYLGNTGYGHQFDTVIEAAKRLSQRPVTFLFVGGGHRWSEIERARDAHGLDNIVLRGYVPKEDTPALMASADCALITLRDSALGVMSPSKMHANLAMGLPILYVGPENSNVDAAIREYGCGASLRHGDIDLFVDFIAELSDNPKRRRFLEQSARRAFDEAYNDKAAMRRFDEALDALLP